MSAGEPNHPVSPEPLQGFALENHVPYAGRHLCKFPDTKIGFRDYIIHTYSSLHKPGSAAAVCLSTVNMCGGAASRALPEIPLENNVSKDVVRQTSTFLPFLFMSRREP